MGQNGRVLVSGPTSVHGLAVVGAMLIRDLGLIVLAGTVAVVALMVLPSA
jgi:hypothetical protein